MRSPKGSSGLSATRSWISPSCSARRHLDQILRRYAEHYNTRRPHRGLDLRTPDATPERPISPGVPLVRRVDVLGGLIHEYEPVAA